MNEDTNLKFLVIGLVIGFVFGFSVTLGIGNKIVSDKAVELGCGEYDRTTGDFVLIKKEK